MSRSLRRSSLITLIYGATALSATAAPVSLPDTYPSTLVQSAKTQCYTAEVCVRRARPSGHRPPCIQWATKTFCEPHVYNNPNKPPDSPPGVRVPKLIAKPKPWQFQQRPSFQFAPAIGQSRSIMRR